MFDFEIRAAKNIILDSVDEFGLWLIRASVQDPVISQPDDALGRSGRVHSDARPYIVGDA